MHILLIDAYAITDVMPVFLMRSNNEEREIEKQPQVWIQAIFGLWKGVTGRKVVVD